MDVSGIPNMGFGGGSYFGTLGGIPNQQPAMSAAQINASMGWNPNAAQFNPWANTPGGFGAQTAYYQQAAANNYGAINAGGQADRLRALYPNASVFRGGGIGGENARDSLAKTMAGGSSPTTNPYAGRFNMPDANPSYFNPGTYAGDKGNYGIPYNGQPQAGDIGFSKQPSYPNLGYNPGMGNSFANPGMNGNPFQNRFGLGYPNSGTPSQYAPGANMPGSFQQPFGVDNPGGALPLGGGPRSEIQPGKDWAGNPVVSS